VFDCLGRPSFFDQAVDLLEADISGRWLGAIGQATPTDTEIRQLVQAEARRLHREIEKQFLATGILGLPAICKK
jgi:hypothetical protein